MHRIYQYILVPAKNKAALRFDLHLGFKQEGIIRNALPDDDIILLGMLKSECIYLPKQYRTWGSHMNESLIVLLLFLDPPLVRVTKKLEFFSW